MGGSSAGAITSLNPLYVAPAYGLGGQALGGALCFSGAFGYPDVYRPGVAPVFAMNNPNDRQMRIDSIRDLAVRDPEIELLESPEQQDGAFRRYPEEPKRIFVGRIVDRARRMSGLLT